MISTRKIYEDLKKFCLSNCCVVFLSAVPVVYRSWQAGRLGGCEGLYLQDTDRGYLEGSRESPGLAPPCIQRLESFHLALDWVTRRFTMISIFQNKDLGLSY